MHQAGVSPSGTGPGLLRPAVHAQLCLAELCGLSELCRGDVSQAVLADGMALHRPILSVSPSPAGMAESDPGMGQRLVVP